MLLQKKNYFPACVLGLCTFYFLFQLFFNQYAMLSVDEFWFAHRAYQYKDGLPYRDFPPYKTVLGYYFLLLPLLSSFGLFKTLVLTKNVIALLNTVAFFGAAFWIKRFIAPTGILLSLAYVICSDIAIFYSTNIRVDLLGYWLAFFSLLCLLEKRIFITGILMGLAFVTTQKSIWYLIASNMALMSYWFCLTRQWQMIKKILIFNLSTASIILLYIVFWSAIADFHTVMASMFTEAKVMYQLDVYNPTRVLFWSAALTANPLFFTLAPLALLSLLITFTHDQEYQKRFFITIHALTITLLLIPYKQVFPYYMIVLLPIYFLLYATFFNWLITLFQQRQLIFLINQKLIFVLLGLHLFALLILYTLLNLPFYFLTLSMIPIAFFFYLNKDKGANPALSKLIFMLIFIFGFLNPLHLSYHKLKNADNAYQRAQIEAVNQLIRDNHDYIAGIELIYDKTQRIAGMRHLHAPTIFYLHYHDTKLKPVMLASLYQDANATPASIMHNIERADVKFYVNNYRIQALPQSMKHFLQSQYEHWWGSIYIYAPLVLKGTQLLRIKFSGDYLIESSGQSITLNHVTYPALTRIHLEKGMYVSNAATLYRLKLLPQLEVNPAFARDNWQKVI